MPLPFRRGQIPCICSSFDSMVHARPAGRASHFPRSSSSELDLDAGLDATCCVQSLGSASPSLTPSLIHIFLSSKRQPKRGSANTCRLGPLLAPIWNQKQLSVPLGGCVMLCTDLLSYFRLDLEATAAVAHLRLKSSRDVTQMTCRWSLYAAMTWPRSSGPESETMFGVVQRAGASVQFDNSDRCPEWTTASKQVWRPC